MDIGLCIEELLGGDVKYGGSTTANTEECYNALRWNDEREKPTWAEIIACWDIIKDRPEPKTELELLKERIDKPLCDIWESCESPLEELLASIVNKDENPPAIPRLDNIEAKINEIIVWVNSQGANIDDL